jgi:hypothetical protein
MRKSLSPILIDDETAVVFLQIPRSRTLEFQASVDLYESLATVRTMSVENSVVAVITTPSMWDTCQAMLDSLQVEIGWNHIADTNQSYLEQLLSESACANPN